MSAGRAVVLSRDLKVSAVSRMESGENVSALARELGVRRKLLYEWRDAYRAGGAEALRPPGRPRKGTVVVGARRGGALPKRRAGKGPGQELAQARQRIAELERKVGQQALEADFFKEALQHLEASARPSDRPGETACTPLSRRGRGGKAD
ncbi:MAG TPA: helix-turn-helix domain-containing protein [Alphaproteobacteria bacterium]|nr:helix-turn-helix domain-containing protein [Alphaproteobacteria bacterium]